MPDYDVIIKNAKIATASDQFSADIGIQNGNFTVRQIAEAVHKSIPGSKLLFTGEHTDSRSYQVSFKRVLNDLGHLYKPKWNLEKGGRELIRFFDDIPIEIKC